MQTILEGKAYVLGDNIDTDQIIPAGWLKLSTSDPEERKLYGKYAMSGVPAGQTGLPDGNIPFIKEGTFRSDFTIIIGGKNFGCGSSREHAPLAIAEAGADDIVLLAGKGHEQGQIVGDQVLPFDDVQVARECAA